MDVIVERQGALDVHKEQVTACVRVPDEQGERISHVAEFKSTVRGLLGGCPTSCVSGSGQSVSEVDFE
jgi:hypothetical protein